MKLIIIGNGIVSEALGHEIDKFDTVIRLGGYKIKGYESCVGSKTDIHSVAKIEHTEPGTKIWLANPNGLAELPQPAVTEAYPNGFIKNDTYMEMTEFVGGNPTLGTLTILMALKYGKYFYDSPITVSGFDFTKNGWPRYYWDMTPEIMENVRHYGKNERHILKSLISEGLVKFLNPVDIQNLEEDGNANIHPFLRK